MKEFWVKTGAVTVTIIALYCLMSPYQQCMRSQESYADHAAGFLKSYGRIIQFTPDEHKGWIVGTCHEQASW